MFKPVEPFTTAEYVQALRAVEDRISDAQLSMLQVQYAAPERMITSTELAEVVGYDGYSPANLHYGRLGRMIAEVYDAPPRPPKEGGKWWPYLSGGLGAVAKGDFRWVMHHELARALEEVGWVEPVDSALPDEVSPADPKRIEEGAVRQVWVNTYERNPEARRLCIAHYGTACVVCGFDFEAAYGSAGKGYIHVHHEVPLASKDGPNEVDPIEDLKPVCPNCHAMIHRNSPPYSIEEVQSMLAK